MAAAEFLRALEVFVRILAFDGTKLLGDLQQTRDDQEGCGGVHVGECAKVRGGGWTGADDCYGDRGGREGGYNFLRGNSGGGSCTHVRQLLCSYVPAQVAVGAEYLQGHSVTLEHGIDSSIVTATAITNKLACTIGSASALLLGLTDPSCGGGRDRVKEPTCKEGAACLAHGVATGTCTREVHKRCAHGGTGQEGTRGHSGLQG